MLPRDPDHVIFILYSNPKLILSSPGGRGGFHSRYVPFFIILTLYFMGCFTKTRENKRIPLSGWLLLGPSSLYYWWVTPQAAASFKRWLARHRKSSLCFGLDIEYRCGQTKTWVKSNYLCLRETEMLLCPGAQNWRGQLPAKQAWHDCSVHAAQASFSMSNQRFCSFSLPEISLLLFSSQNLRALHTKFPLPLKSHRSIPTQWFAMHWQHKLCCLLCKKNKLKIKKIPFVHPVAEKQNKFKATMSKTRTRCRSVAE